jgi:predicted membrane-bound mannosyltransferase
VIRRSRRALPASLVAVVLLAICVLLAVSCVQTLTGHRPWLPFAAMASLAAGLTVSSPAVLAAAVLLAVLGLVLLFAALTPGSATVLPLQPGQTQLVSGVTQRSLTTALAVAAGDVDGVDKARVRVGGRSVHAIVRTPLHQPGPLRDQVHAAINKRLTDIAPTRSPRIRVRVSTRSD